MKQTAFIFLVLLFHQVNSNTVNSLKPYNIECSFSKNYIVNGSCHLKPFDRQTTVFNMNLFLLKPVKDILVRINIFRRFNTFVPFPINFEFKFCELVSAASQNSIILGLVQNFIMTYTNANHSCPFVGEIFVKNAQFRTLKNVNTVVPAGVYRLNCDCFEKNKNNFVMSLVGYFEVTEMEI